MLGVLADADAQVSADPDAAIEVMLAVCRGRKKELSGEQGIVNAAPLSREAMAEHVALAATASEAVNMN